MAALNGELWGVPLSQFIPSTKHRACHVVEARLTRIVWMNTRMVECATACHRCPRDNQLAGRDSLVASFCWGQPGISLVFRSPPAQFLWCPLPAYLDFSQTALFAMHLASCFDQKPLTQMPQSFLSPQKPPVSWTLKIIDKCFHLRLMLRRGWC